VICVSTRGAVALSVAGSMVVGAARVWRAAQNEQRSPQPALYHFLADKGGDMLAPVFDSVLGLYETCSRRAFDAGNMTDTQVTSDEYHLLELLTGQSAPETHADTDPNLLRSLHIALCSTRMMLRNVAETRPAFQRETLPPRAITTPPGHLRLAG